MELLFHFEARRHHRTIARWKISSVIFGATSYHLLLI